MALTPSQEAVLQRLNDKLMAEHEEAKKKSEQKGQPHPPPPLLLQAKDVEFPKWLHKGWKKTEKASDHHEPGVSKLAHTPEQEKELRADGFTDAPPAKEESKAKK